ncbi:hypothetical protein [Neogemmobacter tilapiae]|uniref:Thymidylate synthase n=1 Tax=Neogemmobacter tilapiae TaxID=875041 RepID=A0A918WKU8_9RHOB|nr:hypothetical protein [Gemmobacter tilapiae]GHC54787.1 hypothetical protein GCM10007315_17230 [Gemmobacter tilapiae]
MDMWKQFAVLAMVSSLAACSGDTPGSNGGGGSSGSNMLPSAIKGGVNQASYNAASNSLSVNFDVLDASSVEATFRRASQLDVPGYKAFTLQESKTQRRLTAYFSEKEGVTAGIVADGYQFVNHVGGASVQRTGSYSQPSSGLATYEGRYVGLINAASNNGGNLDPRSPVRVVGVVRINADFTNGAINGGVDNRRVVGPAPFTTTEDFRFIGLEITKIKSDGSFVGKVTDPTGSAIGDYAGLFGGQNAKNVAVGLDFDPGVGGNGKEHGVIVIGCKKIKKGVPCN